MNGALLLSIGIILYFICYKFYGSYLSKLFGINPGNKTPAHKLNDGIDYLPAKASVLFGHHFASIAGAGPIIGPILGICFGWLPAVIWIILGCIFIGAVHDFSALFISIRNEGRSIGHIIEKYIGYIGRQIFLFFCLAALLLVIAMFAILVAKTFVNSPDVATSSILFIAIAVVFGVLVYKKNLPLPIGTAIFVPLLFISIYIGTKFPMDLSLLIGVSTEQAKNIWLLMIFIYISIASVAPVWILLQPRDYLNSYLMYSMILLSIAAIMITAPKFNMPVFNGFFVMDPVKGKLQWALFPLLFVIIPCGACSGFHSLVCSGTTAKQLDNERHILPIGYGAMLLEGVVALIALISVAGLHNGEYISILSEKGPIYAFASGISGFCEHLNLSRDVGRSFLSLTISAFILTTLDTAARLSRFTLQEIVMPRYGATKRENIQTFLLRNRYIATLFVVIISGYLAFSGDGGKIWPVFGASNQLLAALALLTATVVLVKGKIKIVSVFLPFIFMITISVWALLKLLLINMLPLNLPLFTASLFLLIMAIFLVGVAVIKINRFFK